MQAPTNVYLSYVILSYDTNCIELNLFEILKLCKVIEMVLNFETFFE